MRPGVPEAGRRRKPRQNWPREFTTKVKGRFHAVEASAVERNSELCPSKMMQDEDRKLAMAWIR